jgi:F-type H+-transporting ATPase subunit gamma
VLEARPYADKLKEVMGSLSAGGEIPAHPLMEKRDVKKIGLILITSDRGLAGGYNSALIRKASDFVKDAEAPVTLVTVGKKGNLFFGKRGYDMNKYFNVPSSGATLGNAVDVTRTARELYESGEVDAVFICYSKFFSAIRQVPTITQLLPIVPPSGDGAAASSGDIEFEPNAESLLNTLLPRYFQTLIWQSMLESTASEFGARMTAMTAATDSAGKMISTLTLKANRERQASITKEILEVVGGAEALKN